MTTELRKLARSYKKAVHNTSYTQTLKSKAWTRNDRAQEKEKSLHRKLLDSVQSDTVIPINTKQAILIQFSPEESVTFIEIAL